MKAPAKKRIRLSSDSKEEHSTLEEKNDEEEEEQLKQDVDFNKMSRQQRKRRKKVLRASKREKLIQKLEESNKKKQQTSVQENRPIENQDFDFADMHQILKDEQEGIKKSQQEAERRKKTKMTNKKRQKQLLQEVQQLENVFSHPSFVADPINTIQQHLTNKVKLSNKSDNSLPKTLSNQGGVKKVKRKVKLIRRDVTGLRNIEKMSGIKRKR